MVIPYLQCTLFYKGLEHLQALVSGENQTARADCVVDSSVTNSTFSKVQMLEQEKGKKLEALYQISLTGYENNIRRSYYSVVRGSKRGLGMIISVKIKASPQIITPSDPFFLTYMIDLARHFLLHVLGMLLKTTCKWILYTGIYFK